MKEIIRLDLPLRLDHEGSRHLFNTLLKNRGSSLRFDAAKTTFLGALGLQILLSAANQWRNDGQRFSIGSCSPAFDLDLQRLGGDPSVFNEDQP